MYTKRKQKRSLHPIIASHHKRSTPKKSTISTRKGGNYFRASTKDGEALKVLVESGILNIITPKVVQESYPRFTKFNYRYFDGSLTHFHKSFKNKLQIWAEVFNGY